MHNILKRFGLPMHMMLLHTGFNLALILLIYNLGHKVHYMFLAWNLTLAWVPVLLAYGIKVFPGKIRNWKFLSILSLWLLFFPNSPYIITDLVHLNERYNPAQWYDILLLFSCALNGLLLGYYSLHLIHKRLRKELKNGVSWLIILTFSGLSGFGIFIGRELRWNSWDLFLNPFTLLKDSFHQITNYHAITMTIGFSVFIFILYYVFQTIINYESNKNQLS